MKKVLWLMPVLALSLYGADVSGKWTGTIDVEDAGASTPVQVELVQNADALSGKVGHEGGEAEAIRNGKVEGDKITFEVFSSQTNSPWKFTLTLVEDRLEGEMKGTADEGEVTGKVKLTRDKASASR